MYTYTSYVYIYTYLYIYIYIYIYILGGEVLGHSDSQPQKGPGREGIILNMAGVLKTTLLVQSDRFSENVHFSWV